jgi:hypothetical protein
MLDVPSQGPHCTLCDSPMKLTAIEPSAVGHDLRTFTCPVCKRVERHIIESAVTEAWLAPHTVKARHAVTHNVCHGRMTPKPTK